MQRLASSVLRETVTNRVINAVPVCVKYAILFNIPIGLSEISCSSCPIKYSKAMKMWNRVPVYRTLYMWFITDCLIIFS